MKAMIRGNESIAYAFKLARVKVIPAYPITPSTLVPEKISEFIANGEMDAEFVTVESEHSAISAAIGASAHGVRVGTATASQGLALMHEVLFIASGMRLPIVMGIGNRALSAPINIWCDHQDMMSQRDTGWMQFYAESNQEGLDLGLMAFKIAEDERILLPAMVGIDAFVLTHTVEPVELPEQRDVDDFIGEFVPHYVTLDPEKPATLGAFGFPEYFMEFKYGQWIAMERAKKVIDEVFSEFEERFGRTYKKVYPEFMEDADIVLITMGSMTSTTREFVKRLRAQGKKVGLLKITTFRPFPKEELKELLKGVKVAAVLERNISFGFGGAVYAEVGAAFANMESKPKIVDFIVGLGGRDITFKTLNEVYEIAEKAAKGEKVDEVNWIDVNKEAVLKAEGLL
ncbi:2-oxoacid:ferredoxin oxidoreductase, alpha subunit [Aciduliprofundum sp. MAR08-339]|uniref:pyruvate synthase subunit PorA n=1 Tax=Aciduliprofundum sp. (strain MAR08-339) TaxID=673860 RepID=UPI0002A49AF4|nr:2-oxoacid:ferredoxin oxidoreductase, alpha subunit [Aciduliprofundum sp. MAR08-339]